MGKDIVNAIGVLATGALTVVEFGKQQLPSPTSSATTLKIGVALDHFDGPALYKVPDVRLWNDRGSFIGMATNNPAIVDGNQNAEVVVQSDSDAEYVLMSTEMDAVCVAYVSMVSPSGNRMAFSGDWGATCGGAWFYSNMELSDGHKPACTWIDASPYKPYTGFSFHIPSFTTEEDSISDATKKIDFCSDPSLFQLHDELSPNTVTFQNGISGEAAPQGAGNKRQQQDYIPPVHWAFPQGQEGRLVISDDPSHKTQAICDSTTSAGPDLANIKEGTFCRMTDKTIWPLCSHPEEYSCFDTDSKTIIPGAPAEETVRTYGYKAVYDWTKDKSFSNNGQGN